MDTDLRHNLTKYLGVLSHASVEFKPTHTIRKSFGTFRLQNMNFPDGSILSFDIVSMYTKIPAQYAISIMLDLLRLKHIHLDIISKFRKRINLYLESNVCVSKKKVYKFSYVSVEHQPI